MAVRTEPPQNLEPVQSGQHDIQNNQIEASAQRGVQAGCTAMGELDFEFFALQKLPQQRSQFDIVIDNKDAQSVSPIANVACDEAPICPVLHRFTKISIGLAFSAPQPSRFKFVI